MARPLGDKVHELHGYLPYRKQLFIDKPITYLRIYDQMFMISRLADFHIPVFIVAQNYSVLRGG
jgi:hypothetical protein